MKPDLIPNMVNDFKKEIELNVTKRCNALQKNVSEEILIKEAIMYAYDMTLEYERVIGGFNADPRFEVYFITSHVCEAIKLAFPSYNMVSHFANIQCQVFNLIINRKADSLKKYYNRI